MPLVCIRSFNDALYAIIFHHAQRKLGNFPGERAAFMPPRASQALEEAELDAALRCKLFSEAGFFSGGGEGGGVDGLPLKGPA